MKQLLSLIGLIVFLTMQSLQAQKNEVVLDKNQIKNIEQLKSKNLKLKNGSVYKSYKIRKIKQYIDLANLNLWTLNEMENLEPGEKCENSNRSCPDGYECKNAQFLVEKDCNWITKLFGCDNYFLVRTYKECIPINALNNEN